MADNIMQLLEALYDISPEESLVFEKELSKMDDDFKETFALTLYNRYEDNKKNLSDLEKWLQFISNDISSFKEKEEVEKMEFNY